MEIMEIPPARKGSAEEIFHEAKEDIQVTLFSDTWLHDRFQSTLPHRAIGVVYHPEREKSGNYVPSVLSSRYNAFIFIDNTSALHPLHIQPDGMQMPETYPFGV